MNLLLDTHILIWTLNEDPALGEHTDGALRRVPQYCSKGDRQACG